ncbi:MAG: beta-lactamase family protein [Sphingomonadales bacterium]|nr:beta-lactamase family protein [Sphingomonadales bacterium]MBD3774557.1 beta-lactamase family protein [Paracoccaceae bacterium]
MPHQTHEIDRDSALLSRRSLLRGSAAIGVGAFLSGIPLGRMAFAAGTPGWEAVTALCSSYVDQGKVANMVAALGWGQGAAVSIDRGVLALGEPAKADIDSLYRLYSMTKPITGMAVMMLIDEGKLGLDQPLAEILPKFATMKVQKVYDGGIGPDDLEPAARPITIRNLLTHTAGLGYTIIQKGPIKDAYEAAGLVPGQVTKLPMLKDMFGKFEPVGSLEAFADGLADMPLVAQPGTRWSYSVAMDLLGRVVEVASGQSFDAFLQERIFDPCGMASTWFTVPESELGRLTTNYGVLNGKLVPIDPPALSIYADKPAFPMGGAGLVSSPRDYDRFLQMLVGYGKIDGKRVMSELAVRVGTSNLLPEGAETKGTFIEGAGFGAAGRVSSEGSYGWGGAAGTVAFANLRLGLRAGLFTQYMPAEAYPVSSEFPVAVITDLSAMKAAA